MTAKNTSLVIPILLGIIAPLSVIFSILVLHNVWFVFATYQVFICLVAPWLESRVAGRSWHEHVTMLGLRGPKSAALSTGLTAATMLVTAGFLILAHARFLDSHRIEAALAGWGVAPDRVIYVLIVMAVLNATAEELFWRGYFPGRVALANSSSIALTILFPSALYTSYHAAVIGSLVGDRTVVVIMTGGVFGAGLFWGWLRRRTHSVWPALLSHSGAVIAYLAIQVWLTSTGT